MTTVDGNANVINDLNSNLDRNRRSSMNMNPTISPLVNNSIPRSNQNISLDPSSSKKNCETEVVSIKGSNSTSSSFPVSSLLSPNIKPRMGRVRSNSRSEGSRYQSDFDQFNTGNNMIEQFNDNDNNSNNNIIENETSTTIANTGITNTTDNIKKKNHRDKVKEVIKDNKSNIKNIDNNNSVTPSILTFRNKYTYILILTSLNNTFETKFLMIPFKPDILKLGRPVVNNNNNNNNRINRSNNTSNNHINDHSIPNAGNDVSKRNSSSLVRPDNGNFDSRVLSRNHASLTCDPNTGKIYIKDLKSSNGTFINGNRIDSNEVELKVGDIIDLGTDIDTKFEHRKISALVEEITIIPLLNGLTMHESTNDNDKNKTTMVEPIEVNPLSAQRAAFEAAMFGDVNNLDLEDAILGPETEILSGIFINNSIGTSPKLLNAIKLLSTELSLDRKENEKLKSIEKFMINYTTNLEYINKLMIEMNDQQLVKLQETLKKTFTEKHEKVIEDTMNQITKINKERERIKEKYLEEIKVNKKTISSLEMQIKDLKTRLEVEKYKNSCLTKKKQLSSPRSSSHTSSSSSQVIFKNEDNRRIDSPSGSPLFSTETSYNEQNVKFQANINNISVSSKGDNISDSTKILESTQSNDTTTNDKILFTQNNNDNNSSIILRKPSNEVNTTNILSDDTKDSKILSTIIILTTISVGIIATFLKQKFI